MSTGLWLPPGQVCHCTLGIRLKNFTRPIITIELGIARKPFPSTSYQLWHGIQSLHTDGPRKHSCNTKGRNEALYANTHTTAIDPSACQPKPVCWGWKGRFILLGNQANSVPVKHNARATQKTTMLRIATGNCGYLLVHYREQHKHYAFL